MSQDTLFALVLLALVLVHLSGVGALLVMGVRRLRAMQQPLGCAVVLPCFWAIGASYPGALVLGLPPDPLVVAGAGIVTLVGGAAGGWLGFHLIRTLSHKQRPGTTPAGTGAPAVETKPKCHAHGNAAEGTCDRCGDFVCPSCTFLARDGSGKFCQGCAARLDAL